MNNYSALQKLLHQASLSRHFVREISFDIERALFLKKCNIEDEGQHVFVTGLARSGTTILLNSLYDTQNFASLTYEDMPFILCPNLWSKINFSKTHQDPSERAHGDGILVSTNSPEAFEEVFWLTFENEENWDELFQNYVSLILLKYNKNRYLSKNNQNIRRLESIRLAFPEAHILVPFRDPLQHSFSLLTQHRKFSEEQRLNPFVKQYMYWIGHSEFGLDYKPIISKELKYKSPNQLNHWLEQWLLIYENIYKSVLQNERNVHFICYETLCQGQDLQNHINTILNIKMAPDFVFKESKKQIEEGHNKDLLEQSIQLYTQLSKL